MERSKIRYISLFNVNNMDKQLGNRLVANETQVNPGSEKNIDQATGPIKEIGELVSKNCGTVSVQSRNECLVY